MPNPPTINVDKLFGKIREVAANNAYHIGDKAKQKTLDENIRKDLKTAVEEACNSLSETYKAAYPNKDPNEFMREIFELAKKTPLYARDKIARAFDDIARMSKSSPNPHLSM